MSLVNRQALADGHVIVVDLGYGDAGKGTVVDWLCSPASPGPGVRPRTVIRFNGGAQAAQDGTLADTGEAWYVADVIPDGPIAAIALIEHRWAIPLRDAVGRAGGVALADEWVHPEDLVALGAAAATGA